MSEYLPWYQTGQQLVRCLGCGALLSGGDTETHTKWHDKIARLLADAADLPGSPR